MNLTELIYVYKYENQYYLEISNVQNNGKIDLPDLVSAEAVDDLLKKLNYTLQEEKIHIKGFVPDNVIYISKDLLVWHNPAQIRKIMYKGKTFKIPMPGIIYMANNVSINVFAYKELESDIKKTMLYSYPIGNASDKGDVCTGEAKTPYNNKDINSFAKHWENVIWNTYFNKHSDTVGFVKWNKKMPVKKYTGIYQLMKNIETAKLESFPDEVLLEFKTIEDVIR